MHLFSCGVLQRVEAYEVEVKKILNKKKYFVRNILVPGAFYDR